MSEQVEAGQERAGDARPSAHSLTMLSSADNEPLVRLHDIASTLFNNFQATGDERLCRIELGTLESGYARIARPSPEP